MYILLTIILLLLLFTFFAFIIPLNVKFQLDSTNMDVSMSANWLRILKIKAKTKDLRVHLQVFIFNIRILSKVLKKSQKTDVSMLKALSLEDNRVKILYGLNEPHLMGLVYGAISALGSFIKIDSLEQTPDFLSKDDYVRVIATSKVNMGKTIAKMISLKSKRNKRRKNMDQLSLTQNVDSLFHSLENFTQNEGIIGKAVTHGDKTFLPVVSITVGYGGGNASMGTNQQTSTSSSSSSGTGALGLGAKLCTDAVIVIDNQNVSMLSMNSNASTIMDKIPQVVSSMTQNKQSGQAGQTGQTGQTGKTGQTPTSAY